MADGQPNHSRSTSGIRGPRDQSVVVLLALIAGVAILIFRRADVNDSARGLPLSETNSVSASRPIEEPTDGYAGSSACRECHPRNHETWAASYHRTMTQTPEEGVVLGDFDNAEVRFGTEQNVFRMRRHSGRYWIEMDDSESLGRGQPGTREEYPVVLMTGSHHMQSYWFSTGHGHNVSLFPVAYVTADQRWVPVKSTAIAPPRHGYAIEDNGWNTTCSFCHSTQRRSRKWYDQGVSAYDTRVAEFGISCEACHGPGGEHIRLRNRSGSGRVAHDPIVNPAKLPHTLSAQVCGGCHSMYEVVLPAAGEIRFVPGTELADVFRLSRRSENHAGRAEPVIPFHPSFRSSGQLSMDDSFSWGDGVIRMTGREYNGLAGSACHLKGTVSCITCHVMHRPANDPRPVKEWANDQLKPTALDNQSCLRCHETGRYAAPAHTHHPGGTSGSLCYNCHMPHTAYGLLKATRNHTIDSPRVVTSVGNTRPNACNLCHLDRTLEWSAQRLKEWYDIPEPPLEPEERRLAAGILWSTKRDARQRVFAAWHMGWPPAQQASGSDWMIPYLANLLADPYDAVRYVAIRSLRSIPGYENTLYDHVGSQREQSALILALLAGWGADKPPSLAGQARLLVNDQGQFQTNEFRRLIRERDDTPVQLSE